MRKLTITLTALLLAGLSAARGAPPQAVPHEPAARKAESFDRDPGWEGHNHRLVKAAPTVTQDFGYSPTSFAAQAKGEVGGQVWRAVTPAWYADRIPPKTLDDQLSASGTFALTGPGASGVCFGWSNSRQSEGTARPVAALGLQIGTSRAGARLHVRLHTAENHSCGMPVEPPGQRKVRDAFRNDGTRYTWKLDYDPQANGGNGRITFTVRSNLAKPEPFEREAFVLDVPPGYRKQGTVFDRFGLMNVTKPGGQTTVYFGDLQYDGRTPDLTRDPGWEAVSNRAASSKGASGAHDFGFSNTRHAGGQPGEVGGTLWRTGKTWGYYADRVGPLSLDGRLEASGKVILEVGAPDSGMYLGWFLARPQERAPDLAGNFLGVKVAGPSRVGHYFRPAYTTAQGAPRAAGQGPVLVPGRVYDWALVYDPAANGGLGSIRATLGGESCTFDLKQGDRAEGTRFDRFGLFSVNNDGGHAQLRIYFDDLKYTAAPPAR